MRGKLYVAATPIGNMSDMSKRAWDTLSEVDFIAAEDTRVCKRLLSASDIRKEIISYYEHNKKQRGEYILSRILNGENCALVSDAGTPAISDPGEDLCRICREAGVQVVPIPGCCAAVTALSASGFPSGRFTFEGFLSMNRKSRREHLQSVEREPRTMIFYEAPHKLKATLNDMLTAFGGERRICLAREITKIHEEFCTMTLAEAVRFYEANIPKGEYVLIIEGYTKTNEPCVEETATSAIDMVYKLMEQGQSHTSAVKQVASMTGVKRSELYKATLQE